jgi:hypothetical protein
MRTATSLLAQNRLSFDCSTADADVLRLWVDHGHSLPKGLTLLTTRDRQQNKQSHCLADAEGRRTLGLASRMDRTFSLAFVDAESC